MLLQSDIKRNILPSFQVYNRPPAVIITCLFCPWTRLMPARQDRNGFPQREVKVKKRFCVQHLKTHNVALAHTHTKPCQTALDKGIFIMSLHNYVDSSLKEILHMTSASKQQHAKHSQAFSIWQCVRLRIFICKYTNRNVVIPAL